MMFKMTIHYFNWSFKWAVINNAYGEWLIYEPDVFVKAFENLSYQSQIRKCLEKDKYDVFLDVGAAWGHFSIIASKHCKRVMAFEAQPFRYGVLLYNCRHHPNIDCRYQYVSKKGDVPKMGKIQEMVEVKHSIPYNIPVITLDDIDIKPDEKVLIKLDVEGNELKVLDGCPNLIANPNVDWIIDIHLHHKITDAMVFKYFPHKKIIDHQNDGVTSVKEFYLD